MEVYNMKCLRCKQDKHLSEYIDRPDAGFSHICKECLKSYKKERRKRVPIKIRPTKPKRVQSLLDKRSYKLYYAYKHTDKRKGFHFDLSPSWIKDNILNKNCVYCGTDNNIGCDRIDNTMGHTINNVVPCCKKCNSIRNSFFTVEQTKLIIAYIKSIIPVY